MQLAEDAKKAADNYLNSDSGELTAVMTQINSTSIGGGYSTTVTSMSDYTKGRLESLGYSVDAKTKDKVTISWG